jgi:hypothetical protein
MLKTKRPVCEIAMMKRLIEESEIIGDNLVIAEVSNNKILRKITYDPNIFLSYLLV